MVRLLLVLLAVFAPMLIEARRASANERTQRERGGIEPKHDVYPVMQVAYPGVFLVMLWEGLFRPAPATWVVAVGILVFLLGKALKWWAIASLGPAWTFRIIVVPGMDLVTRGPYTFLRHPNYVGVVGELVGVALMTGAPVSGVLGTAFFVGLMLARVRLETRALNAILRRG